MALYLNSSKKKNIKNFLTSICFISILILGLNHNFNATASSTIVQSKTNANLSAATTLAATMDSTATAGNLLVTAIAVDKSSTLTVPTGFTLIQDYNATDVSSAIAYKVAVGGEQTITWTLGTSRMSSMWVTEISGLETSGVLDVSVENNSSTSAVQSLSTGTTGTTAQDNEFAIAIAAADSGTNTETGRAWTNSFSEISYVVSATAGSPSLSVASKTLTSTGTQTSTFSTTDTGDQMYAALVTFKEASESGVLTSTDVEPGSLVLGASGDVDVSFTTTTEMPSDGKIVITFPTSLGSFTFDSGGTTGVNTLSGIDGSLAVATSSNTITLTRSGGSASAPGAKSFTLTNIKNPANNVGSTGTYTIQTKSSGDVLIDENATVTADTLTAGALSSTDVEPTSLTSATTTSVTVELTTSNILPDDGKIVVTFPTSLAGGFTFDSGGATAAGSITGIDGGLSVGIVSNVVTLTRTSGTDFNPGAISFTLSNIQNPPSSGSTGVYQIKTTTTGGSSIDENTSVSADTITAAPASSWYDDSWPHRTKLTIDNSNQDESLTNVPVMIALDSTRIDYDLMNADGSDLRFVDYDNNTLLDHEIERWDTSGTSTVWVKVPEIASASSTDHIYLYYGNTGATDVQDVAGVWSNSYVAVYHFGETSGVYYDSVTDYASSTDAQVVSSRTSTLLGYAPTFGGTTSHYITIADSDTFNLATSTIEAFVQRSGSGTTVSTGALTTIYPLVTKGLGEADTAAADVQFFLGQNSAGTLGSDFEHAGIASNNSPISGASSLSSATRYYVATNIIPGTGGTHSVHLNGAVDGTATLPVSGALNGTIPNTGGTMKVGIGTAVNTSGTINGGWNGLIDEVRISSVSRSDDWLAFQNDSLFDTAITYGLLENLDGVGTLSSTSVTPADLSVSASGNVVVSFTTINTLPNDGKIKITFPTSLGSGFTFNSGGSTAASSGSIDGSLGVGIASNVITITRSGGSATTAGAKSITLTNIQNPNEPGSTGTYSIQTTDSANEVIDQNTSVTASTIEPGSLTSANVEPESLLTNASGDVDVSFTTESSIPSTGKIVITFPTSAGSFTFDNGGTTGVNTLSGIDGSLAVATSSNTITLTRSGGTTSTAGAKSFTLTNVKNPSGVGSTGTYTIRTKTSGDVVIDENTSVSADTLSVGLMGEGTTIGFVSDGDDSSGTNVSTAMTVDINHLVTQLTSGWGIDAITWQGDIAYDGSNIPTAVQAWENSTASDSPLFFTPGNHDAETAADTAYLRSYFSSYPDYNLQGATEISYASTTNYTFEIGDVFVAVVNQYTNDSASSDSSLALGSGGGYIDNSVFNWLKDELKNTTKTHKIVTGHEPLYPKNRHVGDSLDANPTNRNKYVNLLASYGVVTHSVGHTHKSKLEETSYDYNLSATTTLGGGLWEIDSGAFGTRAAGGGDDSFPSIGYFHANSSTWGDYIVKLVQGQGSPDWASPVVTTKSASDLEKQILVNTWTGAGTGTTTAGLFDMYYWPDYDATVEANPDWSANNSGKWWEPDFDVDDANWTGGELAVGYDDNAAAWGWLNHQFDPDPESSGTNHTYGYFGRVTFQATSTEYYGNLDLGIDWEDALIVWLNGEVVYTASTVEITTPTTGSGAQYFDKCTTDTSKNDPDGKEAAAPVFTTVDISSDVDLLVNGTNTLAFMFNNSGADCATAAASTDAAVAIRLSMYGEATPPARDFDLTHYRWRNDNGNETTATFSASEDTATTSIPLGTKQRLRMQVSNEGDLSGSGTLTLQYGTSSDPTTGTWATVPAYSSCGSSPICLESSGLTNGSATTDVASGLTNSGSTFVASQQLETTAVSSSVTLGEGEFTEIEYSLKVTGNADVGETYYFRLLRSGSVLDSYTVTPSLQTILTGSSVSALFQQGTDSYSGNTDTVIKTDFSTTNYGSDTTLGIDSTPDWGGLIKWDISSIPSGVTVDSATMTFVVSNESGVSYEIYQGLRSWTEGTATWNTTDGSTAWGTAGAQNTSTDRSNTSIGEINLGDGLTGIATTTLNSTGIQMIQDWIDGTDQNYGVYIQDYADALGDGVTVDSSESATVANRPKLVVNYTSLDITDPIITDISSSVSDDTYGEDDVIDIDVTFSEPVTSTGSVTVTLDTGGTCTFSVTSSAFGTCNYTVESGDTSTDDLTVSSISGTIADESANAMVDFDPVVNLDENREIVVTVTPPDGDAPIISVVASDPDDTSSDITWTTDEIASSRVEYGLTTGYGTTTAESDTSPRVTSHSVGLSSLNECTKYNYRVISRDAELNTATSSNSSFITTGCEDDAEVDSVETGSVTVSSGGEVALSDDGNTLTLDIPEDVTSTSSSIVIQIKKLDSATVLGSLGSPSGLTVINEQIYNLQAYYDLDTSLTTFDEPITITLSYSNGDVSGFEESTLKIYRWDGSEWDELSDCSVATEANTVSCTTTQFSTFGVFGEESEDEDDIVVSVRRILSTGNSSSANNFTVTNNDNKYFFGKDLSQGMTDPDVLNLQKFLNLKSFVVSISGPGSVGNETMYFGPATKSSLVNYQNANADQILKPLGLTYGTGYFGAGTRNFINKESGNIYPIQNNTQTAPSIVNDTSIAPSLNTDTTDLVFSNDLEMGDIHEDVRALQKVLNKLGFTVATSGPGSVGNETNIFGSATKEAVIKFQIAKSINPTSGYFGPLTRQEISGQ